jgi:hypothetical protein
VIVVVKHETPIAEPVLWPLLFLDVNVVLLLPEQNITKSGNNTWLFLVMNTGIN